MYAAVLLVDDAEVASSHRRPVVASSFSTNDSDSGRPFVKSPALQSPPDTTLLLTVLVQLLRYVSKY